MEFVVSCWVINSHCGMSVGGTHCTYPVAHDEIKCSATLARPWTEGMKFSCHVLHLAIHSEDDREDSSLDLNSATEGTNSFTLTDSAC